MNYVTTALGRMVPEFQQGTVMKDLALKILHDYRISPFNKGNVPMKLSQLAQAMRVDEPFAEAIADALGTEGLVEHSGQFQGENAYRITGKGVVFIYDVPKGIEGILD